MQQTPITAQLIIDNLRPILLLGFTGFILAMLLTPIYTTLACILANIVAASPLVVVVRGRFHQ